MADGIRDQLLDCSVAPELTNAARTTLICVVQHSSPVWTAFLGPAVIAISAAVAFFGIRNVRAVAREKATLDLIEKMESTEHYRNIADTFRRVKDSNSFAALYNPATDDDKRLRGCVIDYLNHYEIVAIGIRNKILDEAFYRAWMEAALVKSWNAAADWIQQERWKYDKGEPYYYPKHYENIQWAAVRWSKDAKRLNADYAPAIRTGGPGDEPLPTSTAEPLKVENQKTE